MLSGVMVCQELKSLARITLPNFLTGLLMYSKSMISMIFVGQLGDADLAAGSISLPIANCLGYALLKGLATPMETICSQAYGAKKIEIFRQTYRRTLFILLLACLLITLVWLNMESLLPRLGQDKEITSLAMEYLTYSIPDLVAQAFLHPLRAFLRIQNVNRPLTISATCATILQLPISYLFVIYFKLGVKGILLASACNTLIINIGLLIHLISSDRAIKPWDGVANDEGSLGWWALLSVLFPSVLSVSLEWCCYEILQLMSSQFSNPQVNSEAMGILIQLTGLIYTFPSSLSPALSTLIGRELGANEPIQAKNTTIVGIIVSIVWGFFAFILTFLVKNIWGKQYTNDEDILALISVALPIVGFCELANSPQTAVCGVLYGSERANMGFRINLLSFYVIGLPISYLLGFKFDMGLKGLWIGFAAAQFSCMGMMICTLTGTDWKHEAKKAKDLTQAIEKDDLGINLLC